MKELDELDIYDFQKMMLGYIEVKFALRQAVNDKINNLDKILAHPSSTDDLFLQEGDQLKIPKELQTIRLNGEVLYPVVVKYKRGKKLKSYISSAGGFATMAKKSKTYVIYANGSINRTHKIVFFNSFPKVEPGAEIVVPRKAERKGLSTTETVSIGTSVATMASIIVAIIISLKK